MFWTQVDTDIDKQNMTSEEQKWEVYDSNYKSMHIMRQWMKIST